MKGILLASHGRLAEGLLDTLQIFCGELQQMQALCLLPGEEITEFMEKLALPATAVRDCCRTRSMRRKSV